MRPRKPCKRLLTDDDTEVSTMSEISVYDAPRPCNEEANLQAPVFFFCRQKQ